MQNISFQSDRVEARRKLVKEISDELLKDGYSMRNSIHTIYFSDPDKLVHAEIGLESLTSHPETEYAFKLVFFAKTEQKEIPPELKSMHLGLSYTKKNGESARYIETGPKMIETSEKDTLHKIIRNGMRNLKTVLDLYPNLAVRNGSE